MQYSTLLVTAYSKWCPMFTLGLLDLRRVLKYFVRFHTVFKDFDIVTPTF